MPIRKATMADAAEIATVGMVIWNETYRGIVPDSHLDSMNLAERIRWTEAFLKDPNVDFYTVVAEQAGEIVGYAAGGPNRSKTTAFTADSHGRETVPFSL